MHIDSELYQQVLGEELRKLRKRRGWTRKQLNEHLQAGISVQTLATYELGTRQCSVVRLAEICLALGSTPHEVLEHVHERLFSPTAEGIQLDLIKVVSCTRSELLPLRRWAEGQLRQDGQQHRHAVNLTPSAVERMAELCGVAPPELLAQLKQISAVRINHEATHT